MIEAVIESKQHFDTLVDINEKHFLDFWYPDSLARIKLNDSFQARVTKEDKHDVLREIHMSGMNYRIMHSNLDQMIADSAAESASSERVIMNSQLFNHFETSKTQYDYYKYHNMEDIYAWSDRMAELDGVEKKVIGKSWEKRDLFVLIVGDNSGMKNPHRVFVDCGIHAREWVSHAFCQYLVGQLVDDSSKFGFMRTGVEWHIMPVVNPDGYEFTHTHDRFWRKNRNPNTDAATRASQIESGAYMSGCGEYRGIGVDLNRNYDAMWRLGDPMVGASKWCTDDSYQGASAFSEPETKAHSEYILSVMPEAYLTMHSYAEVILFPYTYAIDAPRPHNYLELYRLAEKMTDRIYNQNKEWDYHPTRWTYGQGRTIFYPAAGGSDDWAHANGINISYTLELRDKGRFGFVVPDSYLERTMKETAAGVSAVYDHVTRHDAVNTAAGAASKGPPKVTKPSFVAPPTSCGDPAEIYGFKNNNQVKYMPSFSCADNGRCDYTCPKGSQKGKLPAVTCRPNKQFKPNPKAPMANPAKFCTYALSVDNDTDFNKYCSKYGPFSNMSSAWENNNLNKNCKLLPRGTKIVCNFSCKGQRSLGTAKTFVKMTKNGVSAGAKKIVEPICSLAKSCN